MRLIDADKLKSHYAWWNDEKKEIFDQIVDLQPTVERTASWKLWSTTENGKREIWNRWTNCNWPRRGRTPYCPNCGAKMKEAT